MKMYDNSKNYIFNLEFRFFCTYICFIIDRYTDKLIQPYFN
jgi:hypothetical protein